MADGGLTIEIDPALAERLKDAADAAGESAVDYASALLAEALDARWAEARASLAEYDRTGEWVCVDEALTSFRARLIERLGRTR